MPQLPSQYPTSYCPPPIHSVTPPRSPLLSHSVTLCRSLHTLCHPLHFPPPPNKRRSPQTYQKPTIFPLKPHQPLIRIIRSRFIPRRGKGRTRYQALPLPSSRPISIHRIHKPGKHSCYPSFPKIAFSPGCAYM